MTQVTTVIRNVRTLRPNGESAPADVLVRGRRIVEVGPRLQGGPSLEAEGGYLLPGPIDLHTHGIGRETVLRGSLVQYARIEAERGATAFYPAVFGSSAEEMAECLRRHRAETDELRRVPQVPGFRLEGPYLRPGTGSPYQERMALAGASRARISPERTRLLEEARGGHIKTWDIARELEGAAALTRRLTGQGTVCSICPTRASTEEARAMVDAGARLLHTSSTRSSSPRWPTRTPGVYPAGLVDYLLVEDPGGLRDHRRRHARAPVAGGACLRCKPADRLVFHRSQRRRRPAAGRIRAAG